MKDKRTGGQVIEKKGEKVWLVLTESTGKEGEGYIHKCGTQISGAKVAHPIWDSPFPCSGFGECYYETIPYCPQCETEPDYHGMPVSADPNEQAEIAILRKIC